MKTPKEMAEEYANDCYKDSDYPPEILIHTKRATANVFLAGYKAGHATGFDGAMKIQEAITEHLKKQIVEEMYIRMKIQESITEHLKKQIVEEMYNRIEPLLKEEK